MNIKQKYKVMKLKKLKLGIAAIVLITAVSCSSQNKRQGEQQGQRGEAPSVTELISEMDSDGDGQLSKSEVKGPLANDFATIDTDDDGYLSEQELENAPKPQRGGGQQGR